MTVASAAVPQINVDPDPASSYELNAMALTYDGLVAQRHSGGSAGLTIVPDLAVRVPTPTADGTVYTFTLRRRRLLLLRR